MLSLLDGFLCLVEILFNVHNQRECWLLVHWKSRKCLHCLHSLVECKLVSSSKRHQDFVTDLLIKLGCTMSRLFIILSYFQAGLVFLVEAGLSLVKTIKEYSAILLQSEEPDEVVGLLLSHSLAVLGTVSGLAALKLVPNVGRVVQESGIFSFKVVVGVC